MACTRLALPGGRVAIVCTSERRVRCAECRTRRAEYACDWKVPARRSGTCDRRLCAACAASPATGKHLCRSHAAQWARHPRNPRRAVG